MQLQLFRIHTQQEYTISSVFRAADCLQMSPVPPSHIQYSVFNGPFSCVGAERNYRPYMKVSASVCISIPTTAFRVDRVLKSSRVKKTSSPEVLDCVSAAAAKVAVRFSSGGLLFCLFPLKKNDPCRPLNRANLKFKNGGSTGML